MAWAGSQENNKNKKLLRQARVLRKVGNKSTKIDGEMKKMGTLLHRKMLRTCGRDTAGIAALLSEFRARKFTAANESQSQSNGADIVLAMKSRRWQDGEECANRTWRMAA